MALSCLTNAIRGTLWPPRRPLACGAGAATPCPAVFARLGRPAPLGAETPVSNPALRGESQVNMAYMGRATHVPQGLSQRAATAKADATPNDSPSSDRVLQLARVKLKPLVIVHQDVTVKITQALHTPPITLEKRPWWETPRGLDGPRGWALPGG